MSQYAIVELADAYAIMVKRERHPVPVPPPAEPLHCGLQRCENSGRDRFFLHGQTRGSGATCAGPPLPRGTTKERPEYAVSTIAPVIPQP